MPKNAAISHTYRFQILNGKEDLVMNKNAFSFIGPAPTLPKVVGNHMAPSRIQGCHEPSDHAFPNAAEAFPRCEQDGMEIEAWWTRDWLVISEEIDLFPLLEKVLRIVMRRTDSVKGSVLLGNDYGFLVGAEAKRAPEEVSIVYSDVVKQKLHPPLSGILDHICKTRTPMLLNKPIDWHLLGVDPHGPEKLPPSVLCWPFPHGPDLVGVLYLERNQSDRPFGQRELRFLARLSPFISVSFKNANRLKALENRIHDLEKANADLNGALAVQTRARQTLRESEDRYRAIVHSIADGYYEVDLKGNFTFYNDALCEILGYFRQEMEGMNNRKFMTEETARKVYETFNKVYRTGLSSKAFDWELIRKDGQKRWVETSVSVITGTDGQTSGFRGIARDVTAFKRFKTGT
jgi:PAS domain S-box-containing protein